MAQELRKAAVFEFAAAHVSGAERQAFLDRAADFFDYAIDTLQAMPTWEFARPLVLLLAYGFQRPAESSLASQRLEPRAPSDFGLPAAFVSYRTRVKRKAALVVGAVLSGLLGLGALAWLVA